MYTEYQIIEAATKAGLYLYQVDQLEKCLAELPKVEQQQDSSKPAVINSRENIVYECRSRLLKHLFPVTHTNGYPCQAVPKATILSLPQLMGVPDSPITE